MSWQGGFAFRGGRSRFPVMDIRPRSYIKIGFFRRKGKGGATEGETGMCAGRKPRAAFIFLFGNNFREL